MVNSSWGGGGVEVFHAILYWYTPLCVCQNPEIFSSPMNKVGHPVGVRVSVVGVGKTACTPHVPLYLKPAFPLWDTCWSALLSCPHMAFLLEPPFHSQLCPPGLYLILQESAYLGSLLLKKKKKEDFFFLNSMYGLQSEVSTNLYGKYPKSLKGMRLPGIHRTVPRPLSN